MAPNRRNKIAPQQTPQNSDQQTPQKSPQKSPVQTTPKRDSLPTLQAVSRSITDLEDVLKPLIDETSEQPEITSLKTALNLLTKAVKDMSKHLYSEDKKNTGIEVKMRERDDEIDAQK